MKKIKDIPDDLFAHIFSDKYHDGHKMKVGGAMIVFGVLLSKTCIIFNVHFLIVETAMDATGYVIHGLGCIPIFNHIANNISNRLK